MEARSAKILEATVQSFIDIGEPISSGWLYRRYDFGIKPAMIRMELETLSSLGFLEQPYHSAGRVPSDKGYEFYAERIMLGYTEPDRSIFPSFKNLIGRGAWNDLAKEMSVELGALGVVCDSEYRKFWKEGLDNLVENLELSTQEELQSVVKDFVGIENRLSEASDFFKKGRETKVFVGKKSPITRSKNLAVVTGSYGSGKDSVLLMAIGPKRMNYKKALKIFSAMGGSLPVRQAGASGGKNNKQNGRT